VKPEYRTFELRTEGEHELSREKQKGERQPRSQ
jgi:hypothetical protein